MTIVSRKAVHDMIDRFPDSLLVDIAQILSTVDRLARPVNGKKPPYRPVPLGGMWENVTISDADIASVRAEMWQDFGKSEGFFHSSQKTKEL